MSDERFFFSRTALFLSVLALVVVGYLFFATPTPKTSVPRKVAAPAAQPLAVAKPVAPVKAYQPPPQNLASALVEFQGEADVIKRDEKLEVWLATVKPEDIPALIELLDREAASALTAEIKLRLFRKLADHAPAQAAELVARQPEGPARQKLINAIITVWAGKDLAESIKWGRALPESERNDALFSIAIEVIASDPRQALELAREIPATSARDELVAHIASEWASKDPDQITNWAEQIEDATLKQQVLSRVAVEWADLEPEQAGSLAATKLAPGKTQDDAVVGVVQRWVQRDPIKAAAWVSRFPESDLRQIAAGELVRLWADKDYMQAGQWIDGLQDGPSKDKALGSYVSAIAATQPQTAAEWLPRVSDDGLRARQMERIGEAWLANDTAAARAWIDASTLPEDVKERLLSPNAK